MTSIDKLMAAVKNIENKRVSAKHKTVTLSGFDLTIELVASVVSCGFLGWLADNHFTMKPIFFILGVLIGILAGFKNILKKL